MRLSKQEKTILTSMLKHWNYRIKKYGIEKKNPLTGKTIKEEGWIRLNMIIGICVFGTEILVERKTFWDWFYANSLATNIYVYSKWSDLTKNLKDGEEHKLANKLRASFFRSLRSLERKGLVLKHKASYKHRAYRINPEKLDTIYEKLQT